MNLALGQNDHYHYYISAIWEGALCVTAELIEMVQYVDLQSLQRCKYGQAKTIFNLKFS